MGGMAEHTQLIDAINIRTAVRAYDDEPIDDDTARQLEMALQPINLLGDLNIQLVRDQPKGVRRSQCFRSSDQCGELSGHRRPRER